MEVIERYTEEVLSEARRLLETDTEMLHDYPEGEAHCRFCGKWRQHARFDEECPALLRCALRLARDGRADD